MIKRTLCALLAAGFALTAALAGCQPQADPSSPTQPGAATTSPAEPPTQAPTEAPHNETTAPAPTTAPTVPAVGSDTGAAVAALAESLVGAPFQMGAAGPDAFDNSGLLTYCYRQKGITVPRRTADIALAGTAVEREALQPGDAVFFYNDTPGAAQYAGIYIGGGRFVACNNEQSPTKIQDLRLSYFTQHYVTARRFW